jgi:filamentous hemagglutinin
VRVFRVEGTPNTRILLGEGGAVGIVEDGTTLWLNFGSKARAEQYLSQKIAKGLPDATVKSFDVPKSLLDDIRASAVPESMAKQFPNRPIISRDPAPNQFGLRPDQIKELLDRIIQGTGREGF